MIDTEVTEACQSLQEDEIVALESIYSGLICTSLSTKPGESSRIIHTTIPISFPSPITLTLQTHPDQPSTSSILPSLDIQYLPPLQCTISLPPAYPLQSAPIINDLRASIPGSDDRQQGWLGAEQLQKVEQKIAEMWKEDADATGEGTGVIWRWWEWIANGDFLTDLDLTRDSSLTLNVPTTTAPSTLHTALKSYNAAQMNSSFESTAFSCSICLENRKGKSCIQMPCGCVFCNPCLSSCWCLAIEEGTLENVACPSIDCVKQRTKTQSSEALDIPEVDPDLVEQVVGRELRHRWEDLKERRKAETDPSYTTCPRLTCQAAVPPPPLPSKDTTTSTNSSRAIRLADITNTSATPPVQEPTAASQGSEDRWARYRQCPKCGFSFCLYCSATWHGPHTACSFPQTSALVLEYLSYSENSEQRRVMEMRRGKANLERMVTQWREDEENKKWLESRTRACAGCGVRVEKSHGCNHMTCGRCQSHFCYRCGSSISQQDPYAHYRRPGQPCFEKLFDMEEIERFEREMQGTPGAIWEGGNEYDMDAAAWAPVRGVWEW